MTAPKTAIGIIEPEKGIYAFSASGPQDVNIDERLTLPHSKIFQPRGPENTFKSGIGGDIENVPASIQYALNPATYHAGDRQPWEDGAGFPGTNENAVLPSPASFRHLQHSRGTMQESRRSVGPLHDAHRNAQTPVITNPLLQNSRRPPDQNESQAISSNQPGPDSSLNRKRLASGSDSRENGIGNQVGKKARIEIDLTESPERRAPNSLSHLRTSDSPSATGSTVLNNAASDDGQPATKALTKKERDRIAREQRLEMDPNATSRRFLGGKKGRQYDWMNINYEAGIPRPAPARATLAPSHRMNLDASSRGNDTRRESLSGPAVNNVRPSSDHATFPQPTSLPQFQGHNIRQKPRRAQAAINTHPRPGCGASTTALSKATLTPFHRKDLDASSQGHNVRQEVFPGQAVNNVNPQHVLDHVTTRQQNSRDALQDTGIRREALPGQAISNIDPWRPLNHATAQQESWRQAPQAHNVRREPLPGQAISNSNPRPAIDDVTSQQQKSRPSSQNHGAENTLNDYSQNTAPPKRKGRGKARPPLFVEEGYNVFTTPVYAQTTNPASVSPAPPSGTFGLLTKGDYRPGETVKERKYRQAREKRADERNISGKTTRHIGNRIVEINLVRSTSGPASGQSYSNYDPDFAVPSIENGGMAGSGVGYWMATENQMKLSPREQTEWLNSLTREELINHITRLQQDATHKDALLAQLSSSSVSSGSTQQSYTPASFASTRESAPSTQPGGSVQLSKYAPERYVSIHDSMFGTPPPDQISAPAPLDEVRDERYGSIHDSMFGSPASVEEVREDRYGSIHDSMFASPAPDEEAREERYGSIHDSIFGSPTPDPQTSATASVEQVREGTYNSLFGSPTPEPVFRSTLPL